MPTLTGWGADAEGAVMLVSFGRGWGLASQKLGNLFSGSL